MVENEATDHRSIRSVGSTVYQLIMGEPPHFDLQPLAAMYRIVKERRPPLPKPCSDVRHGL
jgi:hypothetical protein